MNSQLEPSLSYAWAAAVALFAAGVAAGRFLDGRLLPRLVSRGGFAPAPRSAARLRMAGLLTGGLFAACAALFPPAKALCGCVLLLGLVGACLADRDHMIIPDALSVGLAAAGMLLSLAVPTLHVPPWIPAPLSEVRSESAALLGVLVGSAAALWIGVAAECALGREALGFGDVKLLGAVGAFCGWRGAVFAFFGGALIGAIALACRFAVRRAALAPECAPSAGRLGAGEPFPFAPMLAGAAALYFLLLHSWVDRAMITWTAFF